MRKGRFVLCALMVIALALGTLSCVPGEPREEVITIRYSHDYAAPHPAYFLAEKFEELADQRLAGKVEVRVYGGGSLFKDSDAMDAIMAGNLEIGAPLVGYLEKWTTAARVLGVPGYPMTYEEADLVWESEAAKYFLGELDDLGIKFLGYVYSAGPDMGFCSKKRLVNTDDFRGLSIATTSPAIVPLFEFLGANAVFMSGAEVPSAFQTGLVDAQAGTVPFWTSFMDVAPYFTTNFFPNLTMHIVVTSMEFWDSLPPDIQAELQEIADEACEYGREMKQKYDIELYAQYGVEDPSELGLYALSDAEAEPWRELAWMGDFMHEDFLGEYAWSLVLQYREEGR